MARVRAGSVGKRVETFTHAQAKRWNIPTAELQALVREEEAAPWKTEYPRKYNPDEHPEMYARNPDLDPQLVWRGKDEQDRHPLTVDTVPVYVQEKIHPKVIIDDLRRVSKEGIEPPIRDLFADFNGLPDTEAKYEFYAHAANWSNRMILGDSLLVMNSLAEKEGLRGQVQMIYIDPPYGIRFASNWQPSTRGRDVRDGRPESLSQEPEVIQAFRDTWEQGVHSYLGYLRDRLIAARAIISASGSIFVQIGDENVHLVRSLLDEIFGQENFCSMISFKTTTGAGSFAGGTNVLSSVSNFLLWYAKDLSQVKYRQLYAEKVLAGEGGTAYHFIEPEIGERRRASPDELRKGQGRFFRADNLTSQTTRVGQTTVFPVYSKGREFIPAKGGWKTNQQGMCRISRSGRLIASGNTLSYLRYFDDFRRYPLVNQWDDTTTAGFGDPKIYAVQTNAKIVERCVLMTTDPGDLVLDPTCGSGTTAYVAENGGGAGSPQIHRGLHWRLPDSGL